MVACRAFCFCVMRWLVVVVWLSAALFFVRWCDKGVCFGVALFSFLLAWVCVVRWCYGLLMVFLFVCYGVVASMLDKKVKINVLLFLLLICIVAVWLLVLVCVMWCIVACRVICYRFCSSSGFFTAMLTFHDIYIF